MLNWKTEEGSTGRLIQYCLGYFIFYIITGVSVKYFTGKPELGFPGMKETEYLIYSTIGGNLICLVTVFVLKWYRLASNQLIRVAGVDIPRETLYIIPSGICTAVIIPTTTLMYTLPISVMVAMVIMRASVIVISRIVDAIQIHQGILKKKLYVQENIAVVFALLAAAVNIFWVGSADFDFVNSFAAMTILGSYIVAYSIRIYIMNYYKNTRAQGVKLDNNGFFAIEQIVASVIMILLGTVLYNGADWFNANGGQLTIFKNAIATPQPLWGMAILIGMAYGIVAFFSVFIFMFKGRTATFAGLVNRLTSLVAGTTATLVSFLMFGGKLPKTQDWISLVFILIAVAFLSVAERKRSNELAGRANGSGTVAPPKP